MLKAGKELATITQEQLKTIEKFIECEPLVSWLRSSVSGVLLVKTGVLFVKTGVLFVKTGVLLVKIAVLLVKTGVLWVKKQCYPVCCCLRLVC